VVLVFAAVRASSSQARAEDLVCTASWPKNLSSSKFSTEPILWQNTSLSRKCDPAVIKQIPATLYDCSQDGFMEAISVTPLPHARYNAPLWSSEETNAKVEPYTSSDYRLI
jgi:hypothetical protein